VGADPVGEGGSSLGYDGSRRRDGEGPTMDLDTARLFARYRTWADRLTYDAVAALPPGEAAKERRTLFKSIIGTLNHNLLIDLVWQAHLEGRPHGFAARNLVLHAELGALRTAQEGLNRWYEDWSEAQSAASLSEPVRFRFIDGEESVMARGAMLLHVVNHASFHRGWVAEMGFAVPAKMPAADLTDYLREKG
jgi:uncharacterized damage-inducible protein DinB